MIHAFVSDVHGNAEALEAVLADLDRRQVTSLVCLGDFVGYGASPNECIASLRPRITHAVAGNHDLAACGRLMLRDFNAEAAEAVRWTDATLTEAHREYLTTLPFSVVWRDLRLVHATPSHPEAWSYVLSPTEAAAELGAFDEPACLFGHSHYGGIFESVAGAVRYTRDAVVPMRHDARYMVNVGSVGQPRDGDPRAAYLLVDETQRTFTHVRLDYDIDRASRRILQAGLPAFLAERLKWGE